VDGREPDGSPSPGGKVRVIPLEQMLAEVENEHERAYVLALMRDVEQRVEALRAESPSPGLPSR
jgi:hypothetical protein